MKALILAAGFGERLRPHTEKLAKPAIPFLNIPLLSFPLFLLEKVGLSELIVNSHHLPKTIESCLKTIVGTDYKHHLLHEKKEILGSGGGIENAKRFLSDDDFLVANGDTVIIPSAISDFLQFVDSHKKSGALASLLVCPHELAGDKFGGVWVSRDSQILGFGKKSFPGAVKALHFTGIFILSPRIFSFLQPGPSNILYDALSVAIAAGERVEAYVDSSVKWFETGNSQDFLASSSACLELLAAQNGFSEVLKSILTRFSPSWDNFKTNNLWGHEKIPLATNQLPRLGLLGKQIKFDSTVTLRGFTIIGNHVKVGENCLLEDSVIGPNINLSDQSKVHKQLIV